MDSLVKCGNGGYAYGSSKPQMSYHRQSTESVTTVVTEINRMTVNDKPYYGGGGVQKQACKVEAFEEHDEAYNGTVAVKKHDEYEEEEEEYGQVVDAEYGAHYGAGGAVKKQGYSYQQEAYGETGAAGYGGAAVKKQGYNCTKEACGESDAGYGAHHGGAGAAVPVQTYAYNQQAVHGGAIGAAVQQPAYKQKDAASKTNGSRQKVYGYGEAVDAAGAGYGAHYGVGPGAGQQHGYQKDAYGTGYGGAAVGKVKKNGYQYQQEAYGGTDAGGYGGAHYGGGGKVKHSGYRYQEAYGGTGAGGYGGHHGGGAAAVQKHGYRQDVHDSETESESEGDESDCECEEAFPPRGGRMQGGVQHGYGAYKQEMQGAGNLGGVRRYESYESREEHGGGRRYESYKSTVQYNGGGHATCSPIKNRHLLRYGA